MKSAWLYLSLQVGCVLLLEREQLMKNNEGRGCEWWSGPRQCGNHCKPFQHLLATQPQPQLAEIWSKTLVQKIIFEGPITDPEKTAKSFFRTFELALLEDSQITIPFCNCPWSLDHWRQLDDNVIKQFYDSEPRHLTSDTWHDSNNTSATTYNQTLNIIRIPRIYDLVH